jgi:AraC-like DNA-binding protein
MLLLNIGYLEMNADWHWQNVCSPFARIYYLSEGKAELQIGGKVQTLLPGHLYLIPPFTKHSTACTQAFSHYYIHFYESNFRKESIFDTYNFPIEVESGLLDLQLIRRLNEINPNRELRQLDPEIYDNMPTFSRYIADNSRLPLHSMIETQGILLQLLARFFERSSIKAVSSDTRINKCLQYIHQNMDKNIRVSQLAGIACISEDHFIRLFRRELHTTPLQYIQLKKIEKAQQLLLTTNMPVKDIALELSMENTSYFNRIFKAYLHTTPTEYRK